MNLEEFDQYCASLPATEMVVQWGNSHVWKVGGKVFSLASIWGDGNTGFRIGFKASDMAFMMLTQEDGFAPLPYLGRYKWVQICNSDALSLEETKGYIEMAHSLIVAKLTRAKRKELGLDQLRVT